MKKRRKVLAIPPATVNNFHSNRPTRANGVPAHYQECKQVNNYLNDVPVVSNGTSKQLDSVPHRDVQEVGRFVNGKDATNLVGKRKTKDVSPPSDLSIVETKLKGKKNVKN